MLKQSWKIATLTAAIAMITACGGGDDKDKKKDDAGASSSSSSVSFQVFAANDVRSNYEGTGNELWITDGTEGGTKLLKDINTDPTNPAQGSVSYRTGSSNPYGFTSFNNKVYFTAATPNEGRELWVTDGTEDGTVRVKDINTKSQTKTNSDANNGDSSPEILGVFNQRLYFAANNGDDGTELWSTDGTEAGTSRVENFSEGGNSTSFYGAAELNNTLYLLLARQIPNGNSTEREDGIYKLNEAGDGITLIKRLDSVSSQGLMVFKDKLYFAASDYNGSNGIEPWVSDGTESGTEELKDINSGGSYSNPTFVAVVNGQLLFTADDDTNVNLWRTDGEKTSKFDVAWSRSDQSLREIQGVALGGKFYFTDNRTALGIWVTDGTDEGTHIFDESSQASYAFVRNNDFAYFLGSTFATGGELWKLDAGGAKRIIDIKDSSDDDGSSSSRNLAISGGSSSDAPSSFPVPLSGISFGGIVKSGQDGSADAVLVNGKYLFSAEKEDGREPWVTNGTEEGTVQLKNIREGKLSSVQGLDG